MTRLVKIEGRIFPRIESSAASHTAASPKRGLSYRKPFISGSSRPRCSTNRLTITKRGSTALPVNVAAPPRAVPSLTSGQHGDGATQETFTSGVCISGRAWD
jgi:hypothetical protein